MNKNLKLALTLLLPALLAVLAMPQLAVLLPMPVGPALAVAFGAMLRALQNEPAALPAPEADKTIGFKAPEDQ